MRLVQQSLAALGCGPGRRGLCRIDYLPVAGYGIGSVSRPRSLTRSIAVGCRCRRIGDGVAALLTLFVAGERLLSRDRGSLLIGCAILFPVCSRTACPRRRPLLLGQVGVDLFEPSLDGLTCCSHRLICLPDDACEASALGADLILTQHRERP